MARSASSSKPFPAALPVRVVHVRSGAEHDDARSKPLPLRVRAVGLNTPEQPVPFRPCLPPAPKREPERAPESMGRVLLLSTQRFGALSPRDEDGRRKPVAAAATYEEANARLVHWRLGYALGVFFERLAALAGGEK